MEISKEQFMKYERVRQSGKTNMFHVSVVAQMSGLSRDTIFAIMEQYSDLREKYLDKE